MRVARENPNLVRGIKVHAEIGGASRWGPDVALGVPLPEIVAIVTSNPAAMLGMSEQLGTLRPGREADVSVLEPRDGAFQFADNSGVVVTASQVIVPLFCLRGGRRVEATSPLVPPAISLAAA